MLSQVNGSAAPYDQQDQCTRTEVPTDPGHGLVSAYTNTQKPLMDSYWYSTVVESTGVWSFILGNEKGSGVST